MIKKPTMENQSLTSNWEYGTLEDAVNKGSSNISLNKVKEDDGEYQLYSAKGYNKNISFFHQEKEYLAIIKDGAGIGRVSKHPAKSSVVATMQYLIPKEGFDIGFVQYFLNGIDFESHRQGSTIPHVYFKDYKLEPFPLLPLPQQKQIVVILDKALAAIDTAKANAEQNLQNAKELFESYLQNVFENKEDDWEEKPLTEVCSIGDGNYSSKYPKASEFVAEGVPFLTATNLKKGTVVPKKMRYISELQHSKLLKGHIKEGDLVIVVRGSSTGNNSIVPKEYENSNLNSQLAFLRIRDKELVSNHYLFNVFNSPSIQNIVLKTISGAAQPQLPNNKLLKIKIPIPSLKEQEQIIKKLESLSSQTKKLETIYTKKITDLEEMKKSVLQKAFSGQLKTLN